MRYKTTIAAFMGCLLIASHLMAAGPASVAVSNRALWPESLDSAKNYNRASRAEILVFTAILADMSALPEEELKTRLRLKSVDITSIKTITERLLGILVENFKMARVSCTIGEAFCPEADSLPLLISSSRDISSHLSASYRIWNDDAVIFYRNYAQELLRLAALFPKTTSEISRFDESERDGFELQDGHFLLTFDDGPTASHGNTDKLLDILKQQELHSLFFLLGERLEARAGQEAGTLKGMYQVNALPFMAGIMYPTRN